MTKQDPRVFLVRAGADGADEEYVLENGLAMIGFREYGSLEGATDFRAISKLVTETKPELKPRAAGVFTGQLWAFAVSMKEGDVVVLPRKLTAQVALGKVVGPYQYQKIGNEYRHTRPVKWIKTDIPRSTFGQDILASFGALMTVCNISRNNAEQRILAVLEGKVDPGYVPPVEKGEAPEAPKDTHGQGAEAPDLAQLAHDQIVAHIQTHFKGHAMATLVDAILKAEGWSTRVSSPGPDGGADILAGRGLLGLDEPRLCVQVKSQVSPADVTILRTLLGTMRTFNAQQGLLVCWGGFNKVVQSEARQSHFAVRMWDSGDLVQAIYRNYEKLQPEIKADLPLKQVWMLVPEDIEE